MGLQRSLLRHLLLVPAFILALGPPQLALALDGGVTYHVSGSGDDAGDGSEASPWRTITHAIANSEVEDTISIGAGLYDTASGESFPLFFDEGAHSFEGPGDGSALISTEGEDGLKTDDELVNNAPISISGLSFLGGVTTTTTFSSSSSVITTNYSGDLIDIDAGQGLVTILNNEFQYFDTAIEIDVDNNEATILIEGNTTHDGDSGIDIEVCIDSASGVFPIDMVVRGNTLTNSADEAIDFSHTIDNSSGVGHAQIDVTATVENNYVSGYHQGLEIQSQVNSGVGTINQSYDVIDNQFFDGDTGIQVTALMSGTAAVFNDTLSLRGNLIDGAASSGIQLSYVAHDGGKQADIDWNIVDNDITDGGDGMYMYVSLTNLPQGSHLAHNVLISGNEVTGNSSTGISAYVYVTSSTGISYVGDWDVTNNTVSGNDYGIYLFGDSDGTIDFVDHNYELRGNTVTDNRYNGVWLDIDYSSGTAGVHYEVDLDMGTDTLYGYNTLQGNGASTSDASFSADLRASGHSSQGVTLNALGNWWGTTDLLSIEDQVWHQADSSGGMPVDFSTPLPDELSFTASANVGGSVVTLAAAGLSGFVSHAGNTDVQVTVNGNAVGGAEISEDYRTLTFDGPALNGEFEVCVTNPGGQSGCASFTVVCAGNNIPAAVSDTATVPPGGSVIIDALKNDYDTDGSIDPDSVMLIQPPVFGTLEYYGAGKVKYTPPADWVNAAETFTYTVADDCGGVSNIATVRITVTGVENHLPTAIFDAADVPFQKRVNVDVLANDYDVDGDDFIEVTIVTQGAKGIARFGANMTLGYLPFGTTADTTDTVTYTVTDEHGAVSNIATVEITIGPDPAAPPGRTPRPGTGPQPPSPGIP